MEATTQINETESDISLPTEKTNPTVTTTVANFGNLWLNEWNTARPIDRVGDYTAIPFNREEKFIGRKNMEDDHKFFTETDRRTDDLIQWKVPVEFDSVEFDPDEFFYTPQVDFFHQLAGQVISIPKKINLPSPTSSGDFFPFLSFKTNAARRSVRADLV